VSRSILLRLVALLVVTAAGLYYIAVDAVGLTIGNQTYTVHAILPEAGGIYTNASVTYRGVAVGKVTALHLQPNQVVVDLAIKNGTKIPANSTASVHELTAAAEQYMDLVPPTADPPYLTNGAVIPETHTQVPTSIGTLLNTVNTLVGSIHASDLNTVTTAFAQGLQNAGTDLRSIVVDGSQLLEALQTAIPGTVQLINGGNTVLSTFNATGDEFASFSHNLNLLSQQVAQSNGDLVALLRNGTSASQALGRFLTQQSPSTAGLIDNLSSVTSVAFQREPAYRALFEVLPVLSGDLALTATGGQLHFEITVNDRNTVCPYTSTMAEPSTLVATADLTRNCNTEAPDLLQRGADKAPPPTPQG
jgi:phospholipid/cholesterol/gamma-HCH transport system substrate-binding protein